MRPTWLRVSSASHSSRDSSRNVGGDGFAVGVRFAGLISILVRWRLGKAKSSGRDDCPILALPIDCSGMAHDNVPTVAGAKISSLCVHLRPKHEHGLGPAAQDLVGNAGDGEA